MAVTSGLADSGPRPNRKALARAPRRNAASPLRSGQTVAQNAEFLDMPVARKVVRTVKSKQTIPVYDVLAVGMIHRVAVGAAPQIKGTTMLQKQQYFEQNLDHIRKAIVCGRSDGPNLVGVLVTEAAHPDADVGIIYFAPQGYWAMCGSGTFALGVFLIECGLVEAREPVTEITLEMVAGLMKLRADVEDGRVTLVSTTTEPVFHLRKAEIELANYGRVPIDISYCLNQFEPQLDVGALGIEVTEDNRDELLRVGIEVRHIVNQSIEMCHPTTPAIDRVIQVQLYDPDPGVQGVDCRCVAIYGEDGFDLTPSGTSTCAHMATKWAKGDMGVGDSFVMQSVTGAVIQAEILSDTMVGDVKAIIPQISGSAQITRVGTVFA